MKNYLLILLAVITVESIIFSVKTVYDNKELEQQYTKQIKEYEENLRTSNSVRDSLIHHIDYLDSISKDILRVDSVKIIEIRNIPKKLQNLTAKETQEKMIELYGSSH